ncbi:hypothetical protein ACFS6H_19880 [Terrimonas rubra]|uniref:Uncharacterized protein n=1 Tax=Terrimonas rubra TaxID=1035890 RepID=A0ABW6A9G8_9BACT
MKSQSCIVSSLQHLNRSKDHMQSFISDNPGTKEAGLFKMYKNRIDWIFNDLFTNPNFSEQVRQGIKNEVNSDVWAIDAIVEKIALLKP